MRYWSVDSPLWLTRDIRFGWPWTIFKNNIVRSYIRRAFLRHSNGRGERWIDWHVERASCYRPGIKRTCCGLYNESQFIHFISKLAFNSFGFGYRLIWLPQTSLKRRSNKWTRFWEARGAGWSYRVHNKLFPISRLLGKPQFSLSHSRRQSR